MIDLFAASLVSARCVLIVDIFVHSHCRTGVRGLENVLQMYSEITMHTTQQIKSRINPPTCAKRTHIFEFGAKAQRSASSSLLTFRAGYVLFSGACWADTPLGKKNPEQQHSTQFIKRKWCYNVLRIRHSSMYLISLHWVLPSTLHNGQLNLCAQCVPLFVS